MKLKGLLDITEHPEHALAKRLDVPPFVAGGGAISTWLALFHTCIEPTSPIGAPLSEALFDAVLVAVWLACALTSRRAAPLALRPALIGLSCLSMIVGTLIVAWGAGTAPLFLLGGMVATLGAGLSLLLWKEFYACLSPVRIALYLACATLAGEVLRIVLLGLSPAYLLVGIALLPVISTIALVRAFRSLSADEIPRANPTSSRRVPVKLLAVVAAYSLCYGLVAKTSDSSVAITALSKLLPALLVILAIVFQSERFGFNDVYRLAMPLAICGGALFCGFPGMDPTIANFFVAFGYRVCQILATVGLGSMARTLGSDATFLFGIELAVQYATSLVGKVIRLPAVQSLLPAPFHGALTLFACLITAAVALLFMRDEKRGMPFWGLVSGPGEPADEQTALAFRTQQAAKRFGLSGRELEILQLLLEDKTLAQIGRELCIAEGTVKSHANRIYRKMSVSGRRELVEAVREPRAHEASA